MTQNKIDEFVNRQEPLEKEFESVLFDNLSELYVSESSESDINTAIELPAHSETFDIYIAVLAHCFDSPIIIQESLDPTLANALELYGGDVSYMTTSYFSEDDIKMLNSPGLWKVRLTVFYSTDYDWESGHSETNLELCVDSATLVR